MKMPDVKRIIIGSDHAGFSLKEKLKAHLEKKGIKIRDIGAYSQARTDYPGFAYDVAKKVAERKFSRGLLVCKSGIGNSIVANRLSGVRAALCYNAEAAKLSREHNDSNILVLGSHFLNIRSAKKILDVWLSAKFSGGRHRRRLNQIRDIETRIRKERR